MFLDPLSTFQVEDAQKVLDKGKRLAFSYRHQHHNRIQQNEPCFSLQVTHEMGRGRASFVPVGGAGRNVWDCSLRIALDSARRSGRACLPPCFDEPRGSKMSRRGSGSDSLWPVMKSPTIVADCVVPINCQN